jgi:hypothetical protein
MTKEEAMKELSKQVKAFNDALKAAQKIADEHGLDFGIYPAYGMGGHYYGKNSEERKEREENGDPYGRMDNGWMASSNGC